MLNNNTLHDKHFAVHMFKVLATRYNIVWWIFEFYIDVAKDFDMKISELD